MLLEDCFHKIMFHCEGFCKSWHNWIFRNVCAQNKFFMQIFISDFYHLDDKSLNNKTKRILAFLIKVYRYCPKITIVKKYYKIRLIINVRCIFK